ncbi:hypothetical protein SISNIDRAFT_461832 [Sistotremastrum niveocremeum HHB9708]|uniref:Uncharacterized protein n=1 Tax=Sistotremastrum niveocremeum HHB9708 TaxID=1314777 RepID=A0A165AE96_9AGAM|nr:hypothetical protein SISNIDRAFT_461832 [Sistotremastrum niveocremeum HHB9708]
MSQQPATGSTALGNSRTTFAGRRANPGLSAIQLDSVNRRLRTFSQSKSKLPARYRLTSSPIEENTDSVTEESSPSPTPALNPKEGTQSARSTNVLVHDSDNNTTDNGEDDKAGSEVQGSVTQESTPPPANVNDSGHGYTDKSPSVISLRTTPENDVAQASVPSRTPSHCPSDPNDPGWKRIYAHNNQAGLHPRVLAKMYNLSYISPSRSHFDLEDLVSDHEDPPIEKDYGTPLKHGDLHIPVDIPLPRLPALDSGPVMPASQSHHAKYIKAKNKLMYRGYGRTRDRPANGLLFPLAKRKAILNRQQSMKPPLLSRWGMQNDAPALHLQIFEHGNIPTNISDRVLVVGSSALIGELPLHYGIEKNVRGVNPAQLVAIRRIEKKDGKVHCADRYLDGWDWTREGDDLLLTWKGESASPIIVYPPWDMYGIRGEFEATRPFWYPSDDSSSGYFVQLLSRTVTYLGLRELLGDEPYRKDYAELRAWLQNRHISWAPFFVQSAVNHKYLQVMESNEYKRSEAAHDRGFTVIEETPRRIRVLDRLEPNDACALAARAACSSAKDTALDELRFREMLNREAIWYRELLGIGSQD